MEAGTVAPAAASTGSKTIADLVALAAERHGAVEAQRYKRDGEWHSVSYEELGRTVSEIARGLIDLGIEPGDRVSLLCSTRPEWTTCDFAISSAGAVVVPIYPTNSPGECEWVAGNSESVAIICEDASQVAKIVEVRGNLPDAAPRDRGRPVRRRRRRHPARRPARARARPRRGRAAGPRRGRQARRHLHDHLHLRHHRPAQGLRALAPQLPPGREHVRGGGRGRGGRRRLPLPAAGPRLRAARSSCWRSTSAARSPTGAATRRRSCPS